MDLKIIVHENRKSFHLFGLTLNDFFNKYKYLFDNLVFNNEKIVNNVRIIDLSDEENIEIFYKKYGFKMKQCPDFEYDIGNDFYNKIIFKKYPNFNFKGKTIFDFGANSGMDALCWAESVGSSGKVISFEPNETIFKNLSHNVEVNNKFDNIVLYKKALYYHNGFVNFSNELTQGGFIVGKKIDTLEENELINLRNSQIGSNVEKIQVECTTINKLVNEGLKPDIIKIDIEGAEYDLINYDSFIEAIKIKSIFIFELHSVERCKKDIDKLINYFKLNDYSCESFHSELMGEHLGFYPN